MTKRTRSNAEIKFESKPADNSGRLLEILERNIATASEPELIQRLRATLARLRAATEEHNGRA